MTLTLGHLADKHGVTLDDHLATDMEIPVLTGLQVQGDVIIVPTRPSKKPGQPVGPGGVIVVRGENGGNTHLLLADGDVTWAECDTTTGDLGVATIAEGSVAWLQHPEHGMNGIGPGTYTLRRQREQADEIRLVAD